MDRTPTGRWYHVWFGVKGRKEALSGEIGDDVKKLMSEIAQRNGIGLTEIEVAADHVHLLLRLGSGQTLPRVMMQLKGATSRAIFLKFPMLKIDLGQNALWQKGYGARDVPEEQIDMMVRYIRGQDQKPLRRRV